MHEQLIGYALNALPAAETAALEARLPADPAARDALARVRRLLGRLSADAADPVPPPELALLTVVRTAEYAVAHRLFDADPSADTLDDLNLDAIEPAPRPAAVPVARWWQGWGAWAGRRADTVVAASIGLLAVGMLLGFVQKQHAAQQRLACEQTLHDLHTALTGYADTHGGRLPAPGTADTPTAGAFADALAAAGQWPSSRSPACAAAPVRPVGYSYTLGYRGSAGDWMPPRMREVGLSADTLPLLADRPDGPHPNGQNVLFAGGQVRFVTVPTVGPGQDDIYTNDDGRVRAGLHLRDAALGGPADVP